MPALPEDRSSSTPLKPIIVFGVMGFGRRRPYDHSLGAQAGLVGVRCLLWPWRCIAVDIPHGIVHRGSLVCRRSLPIPRHAMLALCSAMWIDQVLRNVMKREKRQALVSAPWRH
jgi:hypothetical protein